MKLVVSGGHLTPALALIEYINLKHPQDQITFVGRLYNKAGKKQTSQEKAEVKKLGARFISFESSKLKTTSLFNKIVSIPKICTATIKAMSIFITIKPDVFISFGGYLALPLAIASYILRIPIITHEQTRSAGVANILISKIASKIAISYPESLEYFPKSRTHLTGNLIRNSILQKNTTLPSWIKKKPLKPILYITGGSQGSEIINQTVSEVLKPLLKNWFVIHQCGKPVGNRNYRKELERVQLKLSLANQSAYKIREWVSESELSWIYSNCTGMISRAGANTTEEIALKGIPAILIPLPFSHNDEQHKNAVALSDKKQAILLEQKNLNPEVLIEATEVLKKYNRKFSRNLQLFSKAKNSQQKLYKLAQSVVKK